MTRVVQVGMGARACVYAYVFESRYQRQYSTAQMSLSLYYAFGKTISNVAVSSLNMSSMSQLLPRRVLVFLKLLQRRLQ